MTTNWWTRPKLIDNGKTAVEIARSRVHFWLAMYPQLQMAVRLGCTLDAEGLGGTGADMTSWERYVTTKADLDIALRCCTEKQQQSVRIKFHQGLSYGDTGAILGCSRQVVHVHCQRAITRMAKFLAGEDDKTAT